MSKRNGLILSLSLILPLGGIGLAGCGAAVVGGAAAGGYYVGKDKRSVGTMTDDGSITTKINARFVKDDLVSAWDINVDTYNGVVTLYGSVSSAAARARAGRIAASVKGVRRVENKITVVSD